MDKRIKEVKDICCDAKNCSYNKDGSKCMAGSIKVGTQNANSCGDTLCATFELSDDHLL